MPFRHWALPALLLLSTLLEATACQAAEEATFPAGEWTAVAPAVVGMNEAKLAAARDYALTGNGSGYVTRHGKLVMSWGDPRQRYDLKSTTKSIGATMLGLAIADGKLSLGDRARQHYPELGTPPEENAATGWLDEITILHLATQTAGFEKLGGYGRVLFQPGTHWCYSDGGPNWLADCVTLAYGRDIDEIMFERVFTPLGIARTDLVWRKNQYRPKQLEGVTRREFGSGVSANVDAMARIGLLYLRHGRWRDEQILPSEFVAQASTTPPWVKGLEVKDENHGNASEHYGLLWWNNADGKLVDVPRDAFWSWGLHDSLIAVIPSLDIVAARAGESWKRKKDGEHYDVLAPFLGAIARSVEADDLLERKFGEGPHSRNRKRAIAPYPQSSVITGIEWASKQSIVRRARGSDNWPITWGDDDALYTAYGDGKGFEPLVDVKLSMGLARITGTPDDFQAQNLRAASLETVGDGPRGKKASGMLMLDGVLYLLARNAGNSQLAWSSDHGHTWTWTDWKFTDSFGCPAFLNFGKNYAGARDEYVYLYSHDNDSAYRPADRIVMARAPKNRLRDREAHEVFTGLAASGKPEWNSNVDKREAVFANAGLCYRTQVSYNAALKRYLMCQILPKGDSRFSGGFGVYDAPEPWGPWTTVFFANEWDVGPGETASFPTKWMSNDGRTMYMVFSGEDHFSVRRAKLTVAE